MKANDALPVVLTHDSRSRKWPEKEPLALKLIRDELKAIHAGKAFSRNVCLFYDAIIQLVTMRGNGAAIYSSDFVAICYIDAKALKPAREFLVKIKLIQVARRPAPSGAKETLFYYIKDAPWTDHRHGCRPVSQPNSVPATPPTPPAPKGDDIEVEEDTSSEALTDVSTSSEVPESITETEPASFENPEQYYKERYGPRSMRGVSREELAAWWRQNPDTPMPGASFTQMLVHAMATSTGWDDLVDSVQGGFNSTYSIVHNFIYKGIGAYKLDYCDWMRGALSFTAIPKPKDGGYKLAYFVAAMREQSSILRGRQAEQDHQDIKDKKHLVGVDPDTLLTRDDLVGVIKELKEGVPS